MQVLFSDFVAAVNDDERKAVFTTAATRYKYPSEDGKSSSRKRKLKNTQPEAFVDDDMLTSLVYSYNYFVMAPIWKIELEDTRDENSATQMHKCDMTLILEKRFQCKIEPLYLDDGSHHYTLDLLCPDQNFCIKALRRLFFSWEKLIGFDIVQDLKAKFKNLSVNTYSFYKKLATGELFARCGKSFDEIKLPRPKNTKGEYIPWCSVLNFNEVPVNKWNIEALVDWLAHRGIRLTGGNRIDRTNIIKMVNRQVTLSIEPAPVKEENEFTPNFVCYDFFDVDKIRYSVFDDTIITEIRDEIVQLKDVDYFENEIFVSGNVETINRGFKRTQGHYLPSSFKYALQDGAYFGVEKSFIFITCDCVPSQKLNDLYTLQIVFERNKGSSLEKYKFLRPPNSRCRCPDGLYLCSHAVGCLMWLSFIQEVNISCYEFINEALPTPLKTLLCIPCTVNVALHAIHDQRVFKKKVKKAIKQKD